MGKASKAKQLSITLPNSVGLLAEVTGGLAEAGVNIVALCAYEMDKKGEFMLVADSPAKAKKALSKFKGKVTEDSVVMVEMADTPGALMAVSRKVASAGIDIYYAYATAGAKRKTLCVLKTADDAKAVRAINR